MADPLYIGSSKFVAALDPANGREIWRTQLPKGSMSNVVSLLVRGDDLYVGRGGFVWCLNRQTGQVIWENGLKGMGYSFVTLAVDGAETQLAELAAALGVEQAKGASGGAAAAG
ncbi:MAG: PQQ-binding-like beta-propeller repeat protein [Phycisphaerales bacterium]